MNKEIKQIWVNALRGSNYDQGRDNLYEQGLYCPMGVLAEELRIVGILDIEIFDASEHLAIYRIGDKYEYDESKLPESVLSSIGMSQREQEAVMTMNDITLASFETIADYIEEQL